MVTIASSPASQLSMLTPSARLPPLPRKLLDRKCPVPTTITRCSRSPTVRSKALATLTGPGKSRDLSKAGFASSLPDFHPAALRDVDQRRDAPAGAVVGADLARVRKQRVVLQRADDRWRA